MTAKNPTTSPAPRRFSWLVICLGTLLPLIILLAGAEITLRVINPDLSYKDQSFPLNRDIDFTEYYKFDSQLFWRFRANQTIDSRTFSAINYRINSHGMRGPEFTEQPTGYRILTVGNSCTFGWGVEENSIWARQLETILRKQFPEKGIKVINAGVPGYSSLQGKRYFENELLALKPNMVVIMLGWNDQWTAGRGIQDKEQPEPLAVLVALQNSLNRFKLYAFLRKLILSNTEAMVAVRLDDLSEPRRVSLSDFAFNLKAIVRTARQNNIQPILLVPPVASLEGYFTGTISDFHSRHELYQRQIIDLAGTEQVPVINLQIPFDQHIDLFDYGQEDPIHFNAAGHKLTAEILADSLIPLLSR